MNLKRFVVQGWAQYGLKNTDRMPLRKSTVMATDAEQAAATYARCEGIKPSWWKNGASPRVVIRVNDAPELKSDVLERVAKAKGMKIVNVRLKTTNLSDLIGLPNAA